MAGYIPNDFALVQVLMLLAGQSDEQVVTFGVDATSATIPPDNIAEGIDAIITAPTAPFDDDANLYDDYSYVGIRTYFQTSGGFIVQESSTTVVGTTSGSPVVPHTTGLLVKRTALGGRRGKGRMYLPLYSTAETAITPTGVIDNADVVFYATAWENFRSFLDAGDLPMVLFHAPSVGDPTPTPTPVTQITMQSVVATQRRRLHR